MAEPTSSTAVAGIVAWTSGLSTLTIALFGVDYYSLIWGLVGAMFARGHASTMDRTRAIVYITLASCVGAAIGTGVVAALQSMLNIPAQRPLLVLASLAGGAGAQRLLDAVVAMLAARIQTLGEVKQ